MILFKIKLGQWIKWNEKHRWILSDIPDFEQAKEYIYEFVNEIMEDLHCEFDDIEIIETDKL